MIRDATACDAAALAAIYQPHVLAGTATFETEAPDAAEMAARLAAVMAWIGPWLILEEDGAALGYAYVGPFRTRTAYRFTGETSIYLAPEACGRGLGTALLGALIEQARARGCRQLLAVIGDSANAASIRLHARHGFTETGVLRSVGWKFDRWLDVVLMQRELSSR